MMPMLYGGITVNTPLDWLSGGILPFEFLDLTTGQWSDVSAEYAAYAIPIATNTLWRPGNIHATTDGKLLLYRSGGSQEL